MTKTIVRGRLCEPGSVFLGLQEGLVAVDAPSDIDVAAVHYTHRPVQNGDAWNLEAIESPVDPVAERMLVSLRGASVIRAP